MANGVRRNVAKVSQAERDKLRDAIVALDAISLAWTLALAVVLLAVLSRLVATTDDR